MAKLTGGVVVLGTSNSKELHKVERNLVAIVNEKGWSLATNCKDINDWYQGDSIVDTSIEALIGLLNNIPDSAVELIDKPYRVILPSSISGLCTGSFLDWIRTGKAVSSGENLSVERLQAYGEVMKLMACKYGNIELVASHHARKDEKEKVVDPAWKALKDEITKASKGMSSLSPAFQPSPVEEDPELIAYKNQLKEARKAYADADTEEDEAKWERKIAKLERIIASFSIAVPGSAQVEEVKQEAASQLEKTSSSVSEDLQGLGL